MPSLKASITWLKQQVRERKKLRGFQQELAAFRQLAQAQDPGRFALDPSDLLPCLDDRQAKFDRHYIYHTAWAARILAQTRPAEHIDISSFLYFSTLVSAFIPVQFYDYRPAKINIDGLICNQADLLKLPFADNSVSSLSCMHVVEHVGLGRYGDPLNPRGDLKAMAELKRVLAPGGDLLFVVPVGKPRIVFNAHRIYAYHQIRDTFDDLKLHAFALIPDKDKGAGLIENATETQVDSQQYGCGCFWFKR